MTSTVHDPRRLPLAELTERMRSGALTSSLYVEECLARYEAREPTLRAFAWIDPDRVRREAAAADSHLAAGSSGAPPLAGVPVAVKDIIDTAGIPTECGSALFKGRVPAHDASLVLNPIDGTGYRRCFKGRTRLGGGQAVG